MATKKNAAAKAAKKAIPAKKAAPVKKAAVKAANHSKAVSTAKAATNGKSNGTAKAAKAAVPSAAKKAAPSKPLGKAAASKKPVSKEPVKKTAEKPVAKAAKAAKAAHAPTVSKASKPVAKEVHETKEVKEVKDIKKTDSKKADTKKAAPIKEPVAEVKPSDKKEAATPAPAPKATKKQDETPKPAKLVIPEIKTKSVKKYEPEFIKSVLDTPETPQTGPTMRYSDAELNEFRDLIQKKLDQAKKELAYLQGLITRKDEMGGDESENRYMTMEDGSMSMEREQLAQMASRQINYIDHLEKAIMRIENKTYGICRVTGKLIDKARLRAVPHATLSIEAKQMMNK